MYIARYFFVAHTFHRHRRVDSRSSIRIKVPGDRLVRKESLETGAPRGSSQSRRSNLQRQLGSRSARIRVLKARRARGQERATFSFYLLSSALPSTSPRSFSPRDERVRIAGSRLPREKKTRLTYAAEEDPAAVPRASPLSRSSRPSRVVVGTRDTRPTRFSARILLSFDARCFTASGQLPF